MSGKVKFMRFKSITVEVLPPELCLNNRFWMFDV